MVEIKFIGNTPLEALSSLTAFATHCRANKDVWDAANRILEAEQHEERKKAAAQAVEKVPEFPKEYDTAPEPKPESAPAPAPVTGEAPSLEDIRAKGIEAAKKHGQPAIKAILKELGAENMTNLPEDKRALFLEKLEGLGDNNA